MTRAQIKVSFYLSSSLLSESSSTNAATIAALLLLTAILSSTISSLFLKDQNLDLLQNLNFQNLNSQNLNSQNQSKNQTDSENLNSQNLNSQNQNDYENLDLELEQSLRAENTRPSIRAVELDKMFSCVSERTEPTGGPRSLELSLEKTPDPRIQVFFVPEESRSAKILVDDRNRSELEPAILRFFDPPGVYLCRA